jgi:phosphate-selective porin OprO/OprP
MYQSKKIWVAILMAAPSLVFAADPRADASIEQKLEEQEQRIKILERKLEIADESAATASKSNAIVKASTSGFSLQSADGQSVIKFRANLAVDGRFFQDNNTARTADTWLLRRARPYFEGTVNGIFDFRFMPDFGGGRAIVQDAYVSARFKPWFVLQAGKFKGPVGLERLQPDQYNRFLELGLPSSLVPNRDLGVQISGTVLGGTLNYTVGYFNGVNDGASTDGNTAPDVDNDGKRDWEGRVFLLPFASSEHFALRGLGIGVGGSYVRSSGVATSSATQVTTTSLLPNYRTPGQQTLFSYRGDSASTASVNEATIADGIRRRISPQAYYYIGPFGLVAEYAQVSQQVRRQIDAATARTDSLRHKAWQASASYFFTGEEASYTGFTPRSVFDGSGGGRGAWEVVLRYERLDFDPASFVGGAGSYANPATTPSAVAAVGVGVNWYWSQNVKVQLNYETSKFDGGAASGDQPDEKVLATRFSLVF